MVRRQIVDRSKKYRHFYKDYRNTYLILGSIKSAWAATCEQWKKKNDFGGVVLKLSVTWNKVMWQIN